MSNKTLSVVFSNEEVQKLDELVDFFQKKSISNVTRSDVLKFLVNKTYEVTNEDNLIKVEKFYNSIGIDMNFEVINFVDLKSKS